MKFIDLTQPLTEQTPVFPGDPAVKIEQIHAIAKDGYTDHKTSIANHVGTHIDAPSHMIESGKTLDQFSLEQFIGNGVVIDASGVSGEIGLDLIKKVEINVGDIVLFYTSWAKRYQDPKYFEEYPTLSEELADALVAKRVKMVGVDMCSPDKAPFNVHKKLLSKNILIIENLTNLDQLINKKFTVFALALPLQLDAAQARVIAIINA